MDAISPEIRLTLAPGETKPEPREWRYDVGQRALLHVPTRAIFHVYRVLSRPPGPCMDDGKDLCQIVTQACDLGDKPGSDETPARSRFLAVH